MAAAAETECTACGDEYKTPKILPCAHVLCRDCVLSLIRDKGRQGLCPLCRDPILPLNDLENGDLEPAVDCLPTDYSLVALVEARKILTGRDVCAACDDNSSAASSAASSFCFDCNMKLCQPCARMHSKFPAFKNHALEKFHLLTAERLAARGQVICNVHPDRSAELYCPAHQELICISCVPVHGECGKVEELMSLAKDKRGFLETQAQTLHNNGTAMKTRIDSLEKEMQQGQHDFKFSREAVKATFDELQSLLEERRQELNDEILRKESDFVKFKTAQLSPLMELSPLITSHGHVAARLAVTSPDGRLVETLTKMQPRLDDLEARSRVADSVKKPSLSDPDAKGDPYSLWKKPGIEDSETGSGAEYPGAKLSRSIQGAKLCLDDHGAKKGPGEEGVTSTRLALSKLSPDEHKANKSPGEQGDTSEPLLLHEDSDLRSPDNAAKVTTDSPARSLVLDRPWLSRLKAAIEEIRFGSTATGDTSQETVPTEMNTARPVPTSVRQSEEKLQSALVQTASANKNSSAENTTRQGTEPTSVAMSHVEAPPTVATSEPISTTIKGDDFKQNVTEATTNVTETSNMTSLSPGRNASTLGAVSSQLASIVRRHFDQQETVTSIFPQNAPEHQSNRQDRHSSSKPKIVSVQRRTPSPDKRFCGVFSDDEENSSTAEERRREFEGRRDSSSSVRRDNLFNHSLEAAAARSFSRSWASSDESSLSPLRSVMTETLSESAPENQGWTTYFSASELPRVVSVGRRVTRGKDWSVFSDNLDGGQGGRGTVRRIGKGNNMFGKGWVLVHWDATDRRHWHRMGAEGCCDLNME